jgi:sigma-B regulation protein RsbU (phosphoserine phosphatase)
MYLLDVSGHGVGAALFSVSALDALRSHSLPHVDFQVPEQVLAGMNHAFQMQQHNNLFFTCWYGVYNLSTRTLRYSSGGHPPALLVSKNGAIQRLIAHNRIIGAFPESSFSGGCTRVEAGSDLYIFSDGVYEVEGPDGNLWGLEGLENLLRTQPDRKADLDGVHEHVRALHGTSVLDDDFSILRVAFP